MSKFQLLAASIHLNGDRGNVAVRDRFSPITFPEALVLQAIHGGVEHVHSLVEVGSVERHMEDEHRRLSQKYGGKIVTELFPGPGGRAILPQGDDTIPTEAEVAAAQEASAEAMNRSRQSRSAKKKADTKPASEPGNSAPRVPGLSELEK